MLDLEQAQARVLAALAPLGAESVPLAAADGRVLADEVMAAVPLPPFDCSAMDGYAVHAADLADAGPATPASLRLDGQVAAGEVPGGELPAGHCRRVFTGSPLPPGADAVIMQEATRVAAAGPGVVEMLAVAQPGENVRRRGGVVCQGAQVVSRGDRLGPGHLSLLAAVGVDSVRVGRAPRVGLVATGSELRAAGGPLQAGQIYESIRVGLAALCRRWNALPVLFPPVKDDLAATRNALAQAAEECDLIVTSGGVSVGEFDLVREAVVALGGTLDFWRVAIRPGKPFVFGCCAGRPVFGLPGNPVSAHVTLRLLVCPALMRLQGARALSPPAVFADLAESLANAGDRRQFVRVHIRDDGRVAFAGAQESHALSSLAASDGLVEVPPDSTLAAGARVAVLRWSW